MNTVHNKEDALCRLFDVLAQLPSFVEIIHTVKAI